MNELTKVMIKKYALNKLKYDFMGYPFNNIAQLSAHHLIVPHRECPVLGLGDGYYPWNIVVLRQNTAHDYLHIIEIYDRDRFKAITKEMVEENIKGSLDISNLRKINNILLSFEKEYMYKKSKQGKLIVKERYLERVLRKK